MFKSYLVPALVLLSLCAMPSSVWAKKSKQKAVTTSAQQQASNTDVDQDEKVVLTNFALMLNSFGQITADPHNPAVVGPHVAQMMAGLVNIIYAAFRSTIARNNPFAQEQLEQFVNLSTEELSTLVAEIQSKAIELRRQLNAQALVAAAAAHS